jgi:hypothetical protein
MYLYAPNRLKMSNSRADPLSHASFHLISVV